MVTRGRLDIGLTRPVLAHHALGHRTILLRQEPLVVAAADGHPLLKSREVRWRDLAGEALIILARREGVGLHDAIIDGCRRARFVPKLAHTPSVIDTVLSYVEAGEGIGVIPDSVAVLGADLPVKFRPLVPTHTVDLVMVWSDQNDSAPAAAFRDLVKEWSDQGLLWREPRRAVSKAERRASKSD
jgi:DNA-binding transcriptional LysR family regulator